MQRARRALTLFISGLAVGSVALEVFSSADPFGLTRADATRAHSTQAVAALPTHARRDGLGAARSPAERVDALARRSTHKTADSATATMRRRLDDHGAGPLDLEDAAWRDEQVHSAGRLRDASLLWPVLDPAVVPRGHLTVHVTGRDPLGVRPLVLWRRDASHADPLARTYSARDGRFDFGHIPVPNAGMDLVVTAMDGDPLAVSPMRVGPVYDSRRP